MIKNHKIVFFGTPLIAAQCMQALINKGYQISALVCPPDKPVGRKKEIIFCQTKKLAIENNIDVFQPNNLLEFEPQLKQINPDLILTCAYGKIMPEVILNIPKYKCINVHASLLPKYRGGAPIHWSIINGDAQTGITLMFMEKGMDTGNIILSKEITIDFEDNLDILFNKMEKLAYEIVYENIDNLFNENLTSYVQDQDQISFAYNIKRSDEKIDWNKSAIEIYNLIRGLSTKIGAYCLYNAKEVKIFSSQIIESNHTYEPGTVVDNNKKLVIATKTNLLQITSLQLAGKSVLNLQQIASIAKNFLVNSKFN